MRFNSAQFALLFTLSGCGLLGQKEAPTSTNDSKMEQGCLNESATLLEKFSTGELESSQWKEAFQCIDDSIGFFTDYVRGSTQNSYTQSDMHNLISRFLITNRKVQKDLMRGAFNIKSGLFGGSAKEFTKQEVELLRDALRELEKITSNLLPLIRKHHDSRSIEDALALLPAFQKSGYEIEQYLSTLPLQDMAEKGLQVFLEEIGRTFEMNVPGEFSQKILLVKWLMLNSRPDVIEAKDWPKIFRLGFQFLGVYLALDSVTEVRGSDLMSEPLGKRIFSMIERDYRYREFLLNILQFIRPLLEESLAAHQGFVPQPVFDRLLDELPEEWTLDIEKKIWKSTLKSLFSKLLNSSTQMGWDGQALDETYALIQNWVKRMGLLDRFYEKTGLSPLRVTPLTLQTLMQSFSSGLSADDRETFRWIEKDFLGYAPLFYEDSKQILFSPQAAYTRYQGVIGISLGLFVDHLMKTYGGRKDHFTVDDFQIFYNDYIEILYALRFLDNTSSRFPEKRLQDMDLFTPTSNGDRKADRNEILYWGMMILSASQQTAKMKAEILPVCDENMGLDNMDFPWIRAKCFREMFHKRLDQYLTYFPRMRAYWRSLTPAEKEKAMVWLEHGTRRNGFNEDPIGSFDFTSFGPILHYVESMFVRFDRNQSEILSKTEILDAYPVFRRILSEKASIGASNDYILKGIFTYIVKYRKMPEVSGLSNIGKLGWWLAIYSLPTTSYTADRAGIFNIVCQLGTPESSSQQDKTSVICSP